MTARQLALALILLSASTRQVLAQVVARNDALALAREIRCVTPLAHDAESPLPGQGRAKPLITALAGEAMAPFAPGTHDDAASRSGMLHLTGVVAPFATCEFGWEVRGDLRWAEGGALAGTGEVRLPALAFGGISGDRSAGSLQLRGGASATRRAAYDPRLALERDAFAGVDVRVHLPDTIPIPLLGRGAIKQNLIVGIAGRWTWDDSVRARRGASVVPHLAVLVPIPVLRFDIFGFAYGYEHLWRFTDADALTRHWAALSIAPNPGAPIRVTLRWSLERLADATLLRQITLALHTPSINLGSTGGTN